MAMRKPFCGGTAVLYALHWVGGGLVAGFEVLLNGRGGNAVKLL